MIAGKTGSNADLLLHFPANRPPCRIWQGEPDNFGAEPPFSWPEMDAVFGVDG